MNDSEFYKQQADEDRKFLVIAAVAFCMVVAILAGVAI